MASEKNRKLQELADHLHGNQDRIYDLWWEKSKEDKTLTSVISKQSLESFRNNMPAAISELVRMMRKIPGEAQFGEIAVHGHHRWKQGFDLQDVVRDWGYLNEALVSIIDEFCVEHYPNDASLATSAMEVLSRFMRDAMTYSVRRYDELRQSEAASWGKDLQTAHKQFEKVTEARTQLLRQAAHDLKGGMTAVTSASELLNTCDYESAPELLGILEKGIASVNEMLASLLDLSRLEAGTEGLNLETADIAEMIRGLVTEFQAKASEKGLSLSAEGPDEATVQTDPAKVRRIAQNLMVNAIEHTKTGSVRLCWSLEPERWILKVIDTGPGMTKTNNSPVAMEMNGGERARRMGAFSGDHPQGEGIGLTIVKHLCELLGASTWMKSEKGQGTTFTLVFPLNYDSPPESPAE